jgi:hypothetical protein
MAAVDVGFAMSSLRIPLVARHRGVGMLVVFMLVFTAGLGIMRRAAHAADEASKVEVCRLAPIAFQPANDQSSFVVEQGGLGRLCPSKGAGYFVAPLQLEQGATIEEITAYLDDASKDRLGMMSLVRRRPGAFEVLATTPLSAGTHALETLSTAKITAPVVDNSEWSYLLQVVLSGPDVCLHGAQVTYKVP